MNRIRHTYVLDDPFDDPPQLSKLIPENSPVGKPQDEIAEERLEDNWVPPDETVAPEELEDTIRSKEAHTNAVILQSLGDIPDAEIKPQDNVLFVRELNKVTQDEDLYTIFSHFGSVTSAEIIRDYKTGDSLCFAFIEFEKKEACERAFFMMDNCLIDDRRIRVDFSQSVSKQWRQFRQSKSNANKGKISHVFLFPWLIVAIPASFLFKLTAKSVGEVLYCWFFPLRKRTKQIYSSSIFFSSRLTLVALKYAYSHFKP
jgi:peptidyl-prolyl cis-trans isomerase-like 4